MRHLCCPCEEFLVCERHEDHGDGEVGIVYACPRCGHRIALLANRGETELARSLAYPTDESMPARAPVAPEIAEPGAGIPPGNAAMTWNADARCRIERIPDFVRPIAIRAIEDYALDRGIGVITVSVMDAYRRERGHGRTFD